jgi:NAD(P)-dependent dehydrogenase (short-subunit alcohol dehydrogenase family)/acyl carrier protein
MLVLLEATRRLRLADMVFGLTEGWWRFTDFDLRPDHPLLSTRQWEALLRDSGFERVQTIAAPGDDDEGLSVIVARVSETPAGAGPCGDWLVIARQEEDGAALAGLLRERGLPALRVMPAGADADADENEDTVHADMTDAAGVRALFVDLAARGRMPERIVYLAPDGLPPDASAETDMAAACVAACLPVLNLVQALADRPTGGASPALFLVTRGAVTPEPGQGAIDPVQAAIWGMGGSVAAEFPEFRCKRIDLGRLSAAAGSIGVMTEILGGTQDDQVVLRETERYVARLARHAPGADAAFACRDGSYLITGGFGGLGLQVARMLVGKGARRVVLAGRSEPSAEAQQILTELRERGARIDTVRADVSRLNELRDLLALANPAEAPLRGIVHAAGLLRDGLLPKQTPADFAAVFAPKIGGSWYLHALTRDLPLDFFVLFSSASALLGAPGQAPHAAANGFMDALAHWRQACGLPAMSIGWGPWAEVGAAKGAEVEANVRHYGMGMIDPASGIAITEYLLAHPLSQIAALPLDPGAMAAGARGGRLSSLFADIAPAPDGEAQTQSEDDTEALMARLRDAAPDQRSTLLAHFVRSRIASVLGMNEADLDARQPLTAYGLDSLMALKLRTWIAEAFKQDVPVARFLGGLTVTDLADIIEQGLTVSGGDARKSSPDGGSDDGRADEAGAPVWMEGEI